jgi:hypothetical protein
VFALADWRAERVEYLKFGNVAKFDPMLGWTMRAGYAKDAFHTLDHGIRRNFHESTIRTGAILAVGDSFTGGGEDVSDEETWPAQLERLTGTPVLNGGVAGYATDQIVMRAEQLLPLVRPKTLIVGFLEEDISRAGHSAFGAPKPYFTLDKGELRQHPLVPIVVPEETPSQARTRSILGYSAVLDVVLSRFAPDYWHVGAGPQVVRKVDNDPIGVTCALLQRLKQRADAEGIRVLLFMQYAWRTVVETEEPSEDAKKVTTCATTMGIEVVDQFAALRAVAVISRAALRALFVDENNGFGHLSSAGNGNAAELLARALGKGR